MEEATIGEMAMRTRSSMYYLVAKEGVSRVGYDGD
jgi:hypothetical protein